MATKGREKYNKLNRRRDTIISALADQKCAPGLAEKLRRDGLITNHVYKLVDVHAAGVTDDDRIRTLLNAVLGKVQVNPQIYDKFISILGEIQGLADIVSFIDGKLLCLPLPILLIPTSISICIMIACSRAFI